VNFTPLPLYTRRWSLRYPLDRKLNGLYNRCETCVENFLPLPGKRTQGPRQSSPKRSRYTDWALRKEYTRYICPGFVIDGTCTLFLSGFVTKFIHFSWQSSQHNCSAGARGRVVGWGTMLQAGTSPVRVPDEVDFFNWPNPSSRTMALGSTQPLTEMSTRNLPGDKKRPARRADNVAAVYEPNVWKCGILNLSQP
jgi:hypothetical protein